MQTKIVATLGPASRSPDLMRALIVEGTDVFRINFSHGDLEEHRQTARQVRAVAREMQRDIALLGDLAGPKIRCGRLTAEPITLRAEDEVALTGEDVAGTAALIPISYAHLHEDARAGQEIALDDGKIRLRVEAIQGRRVICRVVEGGPLWSHKGVNLPQTQLRIGAITEDDRRSIALAAEEELDFLGLSFVAAAEDIAQARSIARACGANIDLIAKIERRAAVENLAEILDAADGAMVARGDLGVEIPVEHVPLVQKQIIRGCNDRAKPVITATQMLETMIHSHRPTRAEVTDIANAILDGTDAIMLSGETAIGEHPVEAVRTMQRVARAADETIDHAVWLHRGEANDPHDEAVEISQAACELALDLRLDAIVCLTEGGTTPRRIARYRPACPIVAASDNPATVRRLQLLWGVEPLLLPGLIGSRSHVANEAATSRQPFDLWVDQMLRLCVRADKLRPGQRVVVVAGLPLGCPGTTNLIHVTRVSD